MIALDLLNQIQVSLLILSSNDREVYYQAKDLPPFLLILVWMKQHLKVILNMLTEECKGLIEDQVGIGHSQCLIQPLEVVGEDVFNEESWIIVLGEETILTSYRCNHL